MIPAAKGSPNKDFYFIPAQKYTIKVTAFQPGAARRKLKEENIASMLLHVPANIKTGLNPTVTHLELLSQSGSKIQFDIVNYTDHDVTFDERMFLKINDQKLTKESTIDLSCMFTPVDCQLVIYNEHNSIIVLNKDIPEEGAGIDSSEFHMLTVLEKLSGGYTYNSKQLR